VAERVKMSRSDRAKQFAPFDALKGLQEALRLKEYKHERIAKADIDEEIVNKISDNIKKLEKKTIVKIEYYFDGYYKQYEGTVKVDLINQEVIMGTIKIPLDDLVDLDIIG